LDKFGTVLDKNSRGLKFQKRGLYAEDMAALEARKEVTTHKRYILGYFEKRIPCYNEKLLGKFEKMMEFYKNSDDGKKIAAMYNYVKSVTPSNDQVVEHHESNVTGAKG